MIDRNGYQAAEVLRQAFADLIGSKVASDGSVPGSHRFVSALHPDLQRDVHLHLRAAARWAADGMPEHVAIARAVANARAAIESFRPVDDTIPPEQVRQVVASISDALGWR